MDRCGQGSIFVRRQMEKKKKEFILAERRVLFVECRFKGFSDRQALLEWIDPAANQSYQIVVCVLYLR